MSDRDADRYDRLHDVLCAAVLAGAERVLAVRQSGSIIAGYKDARELVTEADRQSDAAMLAVFRAECPAIDPTLSYHLEESGLSGGDSARRIGADPLDGTSHFASGGTLYSVQAHYIDEGIPLVGVVFQPEVFLPLAETPRPLGRLVTSIRGRGAFTCRTEFVDGSFTLGELRRITRRRDASRQAVVACVPYSTKMSPPERALARRVHDSGVIGVTTGTGGAGGNVMMVVFGGQDVYANFGAGEDLDLAPPQVIAEEAGYVVWGPDRRPPVWHTRKQPFIVALDEPTAERFLQAAGL